MNLDMKKGRPVAHGAAPSKKITTVILPRPADLLNGVFVVLVARQSAGEVRYRRSVYFNLPAAQRAQDRAVERGQAASITLCRLTPVHEFDGGWAS
ncbi:hypothetical protein KZX06_09480 [Micrococcus sp. EYE_162]|uniref:hypothetical protein n=1 Tax=unclassified Micrococcus TaxID=2620948 RepID=UPI002003636E|nr:MULTISPECIES: hypothetical protein [unclassified Micrococcus]MCK6096158.1 hypothetical protein [Micrococcus sp. EYE_212]MCK6172249.1 hypothetical protein [Micrococcus sp. EYE_162]